MPPAMIPTRRPRPSDKAPHRPTRTAAKTLDRDNGYLTWSGDASYGGTFYIVVESTSSAPIQIRAEHRRRTAVVAQRRAPIG